MTAVEDILAGLEVPESDCRTVRLTPASAIRPRPVRWLWEGRMPIGALALFAGREGIGKSTAAYTLAADVTRGRLPGAFAGRAKSVIVAATEDSWEHTIVPRLMAADADLERVFRIDVTAADGFASELVLPADLAVLTDQALAVDAALLLLDPLMSRLSASLDTHKDAEVRRALEPLRAAAETADLTTLGIIHVNKGTSADPLSLVMGSRAFTAVARAVLFVMEHPDDEAVRLLGQPKNNLGRHDLPTLAFGIENTFVTDTPEGPIFTGKLRWQGEADRTIRAALEDAHRGATSESVDAAADWLHDHLAAQGGGDESSAVKAAGRKLDHKDRTLKRAAAKLGVVMESAGFPRKTYWLLPGATMTLPDGTRLPRQLGQAHLESPQVGPTVPDGEII